MGPAKSGKKFTPRAKLSMKGKGEKNRIRRLFNSFAFLLIFWTDLHPLVIICLTM